MTNEEKVQEIGNISQFLSYYPFDKYSVSHGALKMAEWKDKQFAKEKQALIDKACEILKIRLIGDCMSKESFHYFITKFRKAMEETK